MTTFLLIVALILGGALAVMFFLKQRGEKALVLARQQAEAARGEAQAAMANAKAAFEQRTADQNAESERIRKHYESEAVKACDVANEKIARAREEARAAMASAQATYEQKIVELDAQSEHVREHYEAAARKAIEEANEQLTQALAELEPLRGYATLQDAEVEVRKTLADALLEATALRQEAQALVEQTRNSALEERRQAQQRLKEIREQADALLTQATRDAGRIVADAEKRAEEIGGDAYAALRDKQLIEQAAKAIRNVIEGYGDRYVIPTHSLLDDLAADFGHTAAGEALKSAREQSRRMVEQGEAAACDYAEANRRETAIRFVIDAFNGRVDATLSTVKHNNFGTLEQKSEMHAVW
jgi:DNA repair exonuclease SbcCD ATPase subunit